jgi:hypothetical protein
VISGPNIRCRPKYPIRLEYPSNFVKARASFPVTGEKALLLWDISRQGLRLCMQDCPTALILERIEMAAELMIIHTKELLSALTDAISRPQPSFPAPAL